MHLITSINFRAKLIVCLNGAHASAFLPNTEGGNPVIFTTSRHKASLPPSGTKAQKQAVKSLLAPVAPKTRLSLFCLRVFFFPRARCRSQVSRSAAVEAEDTIWNDIKVLWFSAKTPGLRPPSCPKQYLQTVLEFYMFRTTQ